MSTDPPSLVALAEAILKNATTLEKELSQTTLGQPTFAPTSRPNYHDVLFNPSLMAARSSLIEATTTLLRLALGPTDSLRKIITTDRTSVAVLGAIHSLGIADLVPLTGSISISSLAETLQVHPVPLRRILRFAYTMHMFCSPADMPDHVAHTSISAAIPSFAPYIWLHLSETPKANSSASSEFFVKAMRSWPVAPVTLSDPAQRDFWEIIQQDGPEGNGMDKFSAAMATQMLSLHGPGNRLLLQGFDWASLGKGATVVDVGGGNGHNAVDIAKAFPELRFVVQDLPKNEAPAREMIAQACVDTRVRFQPHDFFKPQPVINGKVRVKAFILSRILHDWSDEKCLTILSYLIPYMKRDGASLVLVERVLPDRTEDNSEDSDMTLYQEGQIRALDLLMYTTFGAACERTRGEWAELLTKADEGLVLKRVAGLAGLELSVLEVRFCDL